MKTSYKITLLILALILFLGITLTFLFSTEKTQQKDLVKLTTNQYSQSFGVLLDNNMVRYTQLSNDYTFWDEMCRYMVTKDTKWSEEYLATIVRSYDLDHVLLIAPDNKTIVYSYPNTPQQMPLVIGHSMSMLHELYRKRLLNTYFYDKESNRIGVIFAATIHPTNDEQRLSKPQGYFFILKYWDTKFLQDLERVTGSDVSVVSDCQPIVLKEESVTYYKEIKDFSGKTQAYLKIVRSSPYLKLNHDFSHDVLSIYLVSAILLIIIVFITLYFLIGRPLRLLGIILKGNKSLLPKLKTFGGEYVQIAQIIEQSISTQEELKKAKRRAEESDRLKSAFLANISHEIRTPMNAIIGFSQILPEQFDNKEQLKECTDIISLRCHDLLDIVNSMIDMSRINSGNVQIQFKASNLEVLFKELKDQFEVIQKRMGKERIQFSIHIDPDQSASKIDTDFGKLNEIFVHLLSNAFKFTKEGKIEAGYFDQENVGYVFFVSDTGIGIPKEKQSNIFDNFTRLNNNKRTDNQTGIGLGLAIVKGLIELMDGKIWLESEPNKGSTFYFTVPYTHLNHISGSI